MEQISENIICKYWKEQKVPSEYSTDEGEKVVILYSGEENLDKSGPDFKNAKILIGNITFVGDVEIDTTKSDWKNHGHNINQRYNKVILQIVLKNDNPGYSLNSSNGRRIKSIEIGNKFDSKIIEQILSDNTNNQFNKSGTRNSIVCDNLNDKIDEKIKIDFIYELGIKRFRQKCDRMVVRLKELAYIENLRLKEPVVRYSLTPKVEERQLTIEEVSNKQIWEQLFYESIFEVLGYSQNKLIFKKLSQAVDIAYIRSLAKKEDFEKILEAVLFNVSGLIPPVEEIKEEDSSEYIRAIIQKWAEVRQSYDSNIFLNSDWHFFRLRPHNFPTIRLAGGIKIIHKILSENLINKTLQLFKTKMSFNKILHNVRMLYVVKSNGYWKRHYVFNKKSDKLIKYFIGLNRTDEILLNAIMPFAYIYFELFDKKEYAKNVLDVYSNITLKLDNKIVKTTSSALNLNEAYKNTIIYFGLIELYRDYCVKKKCKKCKIGEKIFN